MRKLFPLLIFAASLFAQTTPPPPSPAVLIPFCLVTWCQLNQTIVNGPVVIGQGLTATTSGGTTTVSVDSASIPYRAAVPSPGPCTQGSAAIAIDSQNYLYFCVPDSTGQNFVWARTAQPLQIVTTW